MVRILLALLAFASFAGAQSHPSWWNYASPGATALVGIDWQSVRASPFAEPIDAELGDLGFPDLPCLRNARQIIVSSPDLLGLLSGNFSGPALHEQAAKKGFKAMTYRGIDMWFAGEKDGLSIARVTDQLILIGDPKTIEMAVDRGMSDSRNYSPLLARAAKFAQKDLWVVSSQLPDALADRFVPLDTPAQSFEGWLSVRNGIEVEGVLIAGSEQEANASANRLRAMVPNLPAIARRLEVSVDQDSITLSLGATREEVTAALRGPAPVAAPVETIRVETPDRVEQIPVETVEKIVVPKPVAKVVEKPLVIRIVGLDDGPKEIVLPVKPDKPDW